jgi:hypothetical protein
VHSPRAGRDSGLATIARGRGRVNSRGSGCVQAGYLPKSVVSPSAFFSQYVMPISRYIVVAVVRCFWACSRVSVRR